MKSEYLQKYQTTKSEIVATGIDGNRFLDCFSQAISRHEAFWGNLERSGNKLKCTSWSCHDTIDVINMLLNGGFGATSERFYRLKIVYTYKDINDAEHFGVEIFEKNEHPDAPSVKEGEQVSFLDLLFRKNKS